MQILIQKFKRQEKIRQNPMIFFLDIDATVSTYSLQGLLANKKTSQFLKENFIPYILITGRTNWYWFNEWEMKLYGLHPPDAVITGNGTSLFRRNQYNQMEKDINWNDLLLKHWDAQKINAICSDFNFSFKVFRKKFYSDKPLFLYTVLNAPVATLFEEIGKLKKILPDNVKIDISESLLLKNSTKFFSGGIFVVPEVCGKAGAIKYILDILAGNASKDVYLFGDASIDIPMLALPSTGNYIIHSYLVNPTPLAKKTAEKYKQIKVLKDKGPQAILRIISSLSLREREHFSPAQNNPARKILRTFEPLLDNFLNKNLTPNEISFLGLKKVIKGIDEIEKGSKIKGLWHYAFGNFTDVLDGIRARRKPSPGAGLPGQLVDGFCDRAREFYQMFYRGKKQRSTAKPNIELYLAISCFLPSIARAKAESEGTVIKERDEKGGSAIDRSMLLFQSLFYYAIGNKKKSLELDREIYRRNMATYENRMLKIHSLRFTEKIGLNSEPFERFLLYVQLLQEANQIIEHELNTNKNLLEKYIEWQKKYIGEYLTINVKKLRRKYKFKDYKEFSLSSFNF